MQRQSNNHIHTGLGTLVNRHWLSPLTYFFLWWLPSTHASTIILRSHNKMWAVLAESGEWSSASPYILCSPLASGFTASPLTLWDLWRGHSYIHQRFMNPVKCYCTHSSKWLDHRTSNHGLLTVGIDRFFCLGLLSWNPVKKTEERVKEWPYSAQTFDLDSQSRASRKNYIQCFSRNLGCLPWFFYWFSSAWTGVVIKSSVAGMFSHEPKNTQGQIVYVFSCGIQQEIQYFLDFTVYDGDWLWRNHKYWHTV
jgi:hypothetical protein